MEYLSANAGQGDLTLVAWPLSWPYRYYGSSANISPNTRVQFFPCAAEELPRRYLSEVSAGGRVWIVVPNPQYRVRVAGDDPRQRVLESIAEAGGTLRIEEFINLSVLLWTH